MLAHIHSLSYLDKLVFSKVSTTPNYKLRVFYFRSLKEQERTGQNKREVCFLLLPDLAGRDQASGTENLLY